MLVPTADIQIWDGVWVDPN